MCRSNSHGSTSSSATQGCPRTPGFVTLCPVGLGGCFRLGWFGTGRPRIKGCWHNSVSLNAHTVRVWCENLGNKEGLQGRKGNSRFSQPYCDSEVFQEWEIIFNMQRLYPWQYSLSNKGFNRVFRAASLCPWVWELVWFCWGFTMFLSPQS